MSTWFSMLLGYFPLQAMLGLMVIFAFVGSRRAILLALVAAFVAIGIWSWHFLSIRPEAEDGISAGEVLAFFGSATGELAVITAGVVILIAFVGLMIRRIFA